MKKIAVITSTRAEYGLLYPLIKEMMNSKCIEMHLLVSGTHLLEKYGLTIQYIEKDGIPISYKIPIFDIDFESRENQVVKAVAMAATLSSEIYIKERYDAIVVLGDRYELLGFCSAAVICRIPIIHIHGGEITEGAIDDKIRHAITKLSSIHFPSIDEYADRIIQMGEEKKWVFTTGALGIDNILNLKKCDKRELCEILQIDEKAKLAAVTYHPVTNESPEKAVDEVKEVLEALIESEYVSIITMPNSDVGGDNIYRTILEYEKKYTDKIIVKKSLGQKLYLSLLENADIMIGNSSSGIIESASFGLPTINIGSRQKGRMAPENVLHCECQKNQILDKINMVKEMDMKNKLKGYVNPYGDGKASKRMVDIIESIDFSNSELLNKRFHDMEKI